MDLHNRVNRFIKASEAIDEQSNIGVDGLTFHHRTNDRKERSRTREEQGEERCYCEGRSHVNNFEGPFFRTAWLRCFDTLVVGNKYRQRNGARNNRQTPRHDAKDVGIFKCINNGWAL